MKNQKVKSMWIAMAIMCSGSALYAQHTHGEQKEVNHHVGEAGKGPHGGIIQEADPYHAEMAVKNGKVMFYLLDGDAKLFSNAGVTASAMMQGADGKTVNVELSPDGDDGFAAKDAKADFNNAVVTFKVKGKSVSAKFKAPKATETMYSCPMHPDVTSNKVGKCSKCGMDLVQAKDKTEELHHQH